MSIVGKILTAPIRILLWPLKVLLTLVVAAIIAVGGVNLFVVATTAGQIVSAEQAAATEADAIVVLGASVLPDGTPSAILKDRLDDAAALYNAGAAPKILVSGDNSEEHYNESAAMKNYLIDLGIPSEDIFCDYAGFSTYETMYRAKYVFGCNSIIVTTQQYHLYRSLFDAQGVGMKAIGVAAGVGHTYDNQVNYDIREVFTRVHDAWQVLTKAPATFSTGTISLAGSGDAI